VSGLVRAELLKLRSASTTSGLTAAMLGLVCPVVLVHGLALPLEDSRRDDQLHVFSWGGSGRDIRRFAQALVRIRLRVALPGGT
jgi:hypothetical protein